MGRFLARRLAMLLAALLVSSFLVFAGLHLAPGSPLTVLSGGHTLSPQATAALSARYRLGDPFLAQYWYWLTDAVHGNLGQSISLRASVASVISARIGVTFELVVLAGLIVVIVGIGLGTVAGLRRGAVDTLVVTLTSGVAAVPSFVAAIILLSAFSVSLGVFPALGAGQGVLDRLDHLVLPAVALAASAMAFVARVTRVTVREEAAREHVQTALARGIPRHRVLRHHILRNAAIPISTVAGITVTSLIALAAVVETAFSINGLGSTLVQAASSKDFALVQGITLILVASFVIANTLVDVLYAVLDPRVSLGRRAA